MDHWLDVIEGSFSILVTGLFVSPEFFSRTSSPYSGNQKCFFPLPLGFQGVRLGETAAGTALPKPSSTLNVEAGCTVPNPCDSSPCPLNSLCRDKWQTYSCVCKPGRRWTKQPCLRFLSVTLHFVSLFLVLVLITAFGTVGS